MSVLTDYLNYYAEKRAEQQKPAVAHVPHVSMYMSILLLQLGLIFSREHEFEWQNASQWFHCEKS